MNPSPGQDKGKDAAGMDKGKEPGKDAASGSDPSGGLQKAFDAFAKLGGSKDGKIKSDSIQQWLKKAGISGVSDEDIKKHFGKDGGLDLNEFKQGIEKLAKDTKQEKDDLMKKLTSALPSKEDVNKKMEDATAKVGEKIEGAKGKVDEKAKDAKDKLSGEKK